MVQKLAVKGEIVTCPNGHPMFKVLRDLLPHDIIRSDSFQGLNGLHNPRTGERLDEYRCPKCNSYSFDLVSLYVNGQPRGGGLYSPWEPVHEKVSMPEYIEGVARGVLTIIDGVVHRRLQQGVSDDIP
jgi:hypothetical protein